MNSRSFYIASMTVFLIYGMIAQKYKFFPQPQLSYMLEQSIFAVSEFKGNDWYYVEAINRKVVPQYKASEVQPGLTLITGIGKNHGLFIKVIDINGEIVHQWDINWYKIWPDADHIPDHLIPKGKPGTHIHGSKLMKNGDIVFNFENLGLIRLDICGKAVFKVAYPTHHTVGLNNNSDFLLPGQTYHQKKLPRYPNHIPPFKADNVVKISADGKVLSEISIMTLLEKNNYQGLMYLSTTASRDTSVTGDIFHLNDVEVFPLHMKEGVFKHGDIMISLRNINTVLVFNPKTLKIRYLISGKFIRQHDPDFIDGNTFSVYDNNHFAPTNFGHNSKIVIVSALNNHVRSYFPENNKLRFYSNIMGKHQWLKNGNLLILELMNGRVFEINQQKKIVWTYNNIIQNNKKVGIMEGAERLPLQFNRQFFDKETDACRL